MSYLLPIWLILSGLGNALLTAFKALIALFGGTFPMLMFSGCLLMSMGCAAVMHVTNNFPPGRNEAGVFNRSTNDVGVFSDTGEKSQQEASSMMIGGTIAKPTEEVKMPTQPSPPPDVSGRARNPEPPSSPGATPRTP